MIVIKFSSDMNSLRHAGKLANKEGRQPVSNKLAKMHVGKICTLWKYALWKTTLQNVRYGS